MLSFTCDYYMENLSHEDVWGKSLWEDIWRRCICLDLLPSGACKLPPPGGGDRWEETGQVSVGGEKCRPKHILRGRDKLWHSMLLSQSDSKAILFWFVRVCELVCLSVSIISPEPPNIFLKKVVAHQQLIHIWSQAKSRWMPLQSILSEHQYCYTSELRTWYLVC